MAKDRTGHKQGDVNVGETTPHPHQDDNWDNQVNGQPPAESISAAPDSPYPERECNKKGSNQKGGKKEGVMNI